MPAHSTLTGANLHIPFKTGLASALPATCAIGDTYEATDTGKIYKCFVLNVWQEITYGQANFQDPDGLTVILNTTHPTYQVDVDATGINVGGIRLSAVNLTIDIAATAGVNALDTGTEAISTWYSVWIIYNPTTGTTAGLLSTSGTAPTMPSGYTLKRLVGWVRNNDDGDFFLIENLSDTYHDRAATYDESDFNADVLTCDNAWHDLDLSAIIPPSVKAVHLIVSLSHATGGYVMFLRKKGTSNTTVISKIISYGLSEIIVPVNSAGVIEYITSNVVGLSIFISVKGWWR